jgi:hypothetical protein
MIGFEMTGRGQHGFYYHTSPWTEGSLLFLKLAAQARKLPLPMWASIPVNKGVGGAASKEVGAVSAFFSELKQTLLYDVANLGLDAFLVVWGDVFFKHSFTPVKTGDQAAFEFLTKVADAKLGEQVVIHLCRCLQEFRLAVIDKDQSNLWIYVKIEL